MKEIKREDVVYNIPQSTILFVFAGSFFVGLGTNLAVGVGVFILAMLFFGFVGLVQEFLFQILEKLNRGG